MNKLKIGLFIDSYFPMVDGVVMVVDNYARLLSSKAEITVFCPKASKDYVDNFNYKTIRSKSLNVFNFDYVLPVPKLDKHFKKKLQESNLDIVHIHSPFGIGKMGFKYAKKHHIPCIASLHSQFKQDFYNVSKSKLITKLLTKTVLKIYNKCDVCWAVNNDIKDLFVNEYKLKSPCTLQLNGTEMRFLEDNSYKKDFDKKYNIKEDEKVFLFTGRLIELKNILFIVDSLKLLKNKGIKFKMFYLGSGPDKKKLEQKIAQNHLQDYIFLCGRIDDRQELTKFYNRADLFLFPSMYDANSLVQIEASSQKTPTIFLKGSKTSSLIIDNVNGFISEPTIESFAQKIIEVLNNKELYDKVSNGAYRDLYLSWDKVVNKVYNDYCNVLK